MSLATVAKRGPTLGLEMIRFLLMPRQFATRTLENFRDVLPKKEVLAWSFAFSALIFALYPLFLGHTLLDAINEVAGVDRSTDKIEQDITKPTFEKYYVGIQAGGGVEFPDVFSLDKPQTAIFMFGPGAIVVKNVVPSKVGTKVAGALLLNIL